MTKAFFLKKASTCGHCISSCSCAKLLHKAKSKGRSHGHEHRKAITATKWKKEIRFLFFQKQTAQHPLSPLKGSKYYFTEDKK